MKALHVLLLQFIISTLLFAQSIEVQLDTSEIKIGQQTRLIVTYNIPAGSRTIFLPAIKPDTLTKSIEIVGPIKQDTIQQQDETKHIFRISRTMTITSFDTGQHIIPPFQFFYELNGDTIAVQSDTLFLKVLTVPADTTQPIKDIKAPWRVPITFRDIAPYLFGSIFLLILLLAALYIWQRRRKGLPLFPAKREVYVDPYDEVIHQLTQLQKQKIWQHGQIKMYYTLLADALRRYIERQFQIRAMEMTTSETLEHISTHEILHQQSKNLEHILTTADMVKFARFVPPVTEHEHCLTLAYEFVESTRPIPPDQQQTSEHSAESQTEQQ